MERWRWDGKKEDVRSRSVVANTCESFAVFEYLSLRLVHTAYTIHGFVKRGSKEQTEESEEQKTENSTSDGRKLLEGRRNRSE